MSISSMLIKETTWHNAWEWHHGIQLHSVTDLLHWAVNGEGLVHVGGLGPTALAPNDHSSCCVELLFKLHIFLSDTQAAFPKLPAFLSIKTYPSGQHNEWRSKNTKFTKLYVCVLLWNTTLTSQIILVPWKKKNLSNTVVQTESITPAEF